MLREVEAMFVCVTCVEQYEGPAVENAKAFGRLGMSYGPCELCGVTAGCYDIPSSANWHRKSEADQVRNALRDDPFVDNETYGRLVEEADQQDQQREWQAEVPDE